MQLLPLLVQLSYTYLGIEYIRPVTLVIVYGICMRKFTEYIAQT